MILLLLLYFWSNKFSLGEHARFLSKTLELTNHKILNLTISKKKKKKLIKTYYIIYWFTFLQTLTVPVYLSFVPSWPENNVSF